MKRMKKILLTFVVVILVVPSFLVIATTNDSKVENAIPENDGVVSSKDEVVYATLSATGDQQEIYVVNTLEVEKAGKIVDYGSYSSLKNLSDLSEIEQIGDQVQLTAEEGEFFYQGNMNDVPLPWKIDIAYFLDGKKMSPEMLAGKDGHVQIRIKTSANEKADSFFANNYLLQISLPLDTSIFRHIEADDGMIANVGKNKQVTFTVMPEKEGDFLLEADVAGFELTGIDITAVPSSMSIDAPDVDQMTDEMKTLSSAIAKLNDGVAKLKNGVAELNNGVADLQAGSNQYKKGINDLDRASAELVTGSKEIGKALKTVSHSLGNMEGMNLSEMKQLGAGLTSISTGLTETANGLATLKENYAGAYRALDEAMAKIPVYHITEGDIQALYGSGANQEVVGKLVETYTAALTAKGTYSHVKPAFDAVDGTLTKVIHALTEMATNLNKMATGLAASLENIEDIDRLSELVEGIATLSSNYQTFHSGLVTYTNGVGQLSRSYADLHIGIEQLSAGTNELDQGVDQLHAGTTKLHESTNDLPEKMQAEIDQMISEYDKSDVDAISFVSSKNEKVNLVQFVLKTESIQLDKTDIIEEPEQKEKGFWARLMDLFK